MSYTKTTWNTGDVITAAKLNNLETEYDNATADAAASAQALYVRQDGSTPINGNQTVNGSEIVNGNVTVNTVGGNGNLTVAYPGNAALGNGLTVGGAALFNGSSASVSGILNVGGAATLSGTLQVAGQTTLGPVVLNGPLSGPYAPGTSGGTVTGTGTVGNIAKFSGASTLANSILSESGGIATVTGTLNATTAVTVGGSLLTRSATVTVAASNSSPVDKKAADVVCTGTADQGMINGALALITTVNSTTPGKVVLMEGDYYITGPIGNFSFIPPLLSIEGVGPGTQIHIANGTNGTFTMLDMQPITGVNHDILIRNLTLDGNRANQTAGTMHGITMPVGANNIRFDKLLIKNCKGDGVHIDASAGTSASIIEFSQCSAINNSSDGFYLNKVDQVLLAFCTATGNGLDGIGLVGSTQGRIQGCYASSNINGIVLDTVTRSSLVGNVIQNNTQMGIRFNGTCTYNTVTGNTSQFNTVNGIDFSSGQENNISSNSVTANGSTGITAVNALNNSISGNAVYANNSNGIRLNSGSSYNHITSNIVVGQVQPGIYIVGPDNDVAGNQSYGNSAYGIYTVGPRTQIVGNAVRANNQEGIYVDSAPDCQVVGNTLYQNGLGTNNTYAQIRIGVGSSRALVQGNQIRNAASGNLAKYGILVDSVTTDIQVINNDIYNSGATANFSDAGTRTLLQSITPTLPLIPPPAAATWTWVNQVSATVADQAGGIYLYSPSDAGDSLHILKVAVPTAPYSRVIRVEHILMPPTSGWTQFGFVLRNSTSGNVVTLGIGYNSVDAQYRLNVNKWTSPTVFSANYTSAFTPMDWPWLKVNDDGTNRVFSVSRDGHNFTQIHSVGRTDFITPDEIGFFIQSKGRELGVLLLSWS